MINFHIENTRNYINILNIIFSGFNLFFKISGYIFDTI